MYDMVYIYVCMYYIYIYTHTHICTYTYIHIYIYNVPTRCGSVCGGRQRSQRLKLHP